MVASVSLKNVIKSYENHIVVHGIDLEILPGEFVVLVGPSGCGKSTTLRMIAGLEDISGGVIRIDNKIINDLAPKNRDVAMVFQNYALYPHLNVSDNISFGLRLRGIKKNIIEKSVAVAADILGLEPLLKRKPSELSGGQRQRVAMGRAIVRDPKVFLFDEPLSNLDAKLRTQMRAEIKRLHSRLGTTIIYVTHDQVEAMTLADRIVVMRDGVIEQVGAPMDLFNKPVNTFVASFIGSPPMNLMPAQLRSGDDRIQVIINEKNQVNLPYKEEAQVIDGQKVVFGIRPEDLVLDPNPETGSEKLKGIVDLIEPLGAESILHISLGEINLIAKIEGRGRTIIQGQDIDLYVNLNRISLFDDKTQKSIY